jgi:hypothetical protein
MQFSSVLRLVLTSIILSTSSQISLANEDLSTAEKNSIVKEDVAAMQVLKDYCPTVIGKNAKFDQNVQNLLAEYLSEYSDISMTLQKLQQDVEYQKILKETQKSLNETSIDDNKFACEEIITIDM